MVDQDLKQNGQWCGKLSLGKEWGLGDEVSRIPRIREVFSRKEQHIRHVGKRTQVVRIYEIWIAADHQKRQVISLRSRQELDEAMDCLRRRAPAAVLLLLLALLGAGWLTVSLISMAGGGENGGGFSAALEALEEAPTNTDSCKVAITSYLEQSQMKLAFNYVFLLVKQVAGVWRPSGAMAGRWTHETFRSLKAAPEPLKRTTPPWRNMTTTARPSISSPTQTP